MPKRSVSSHKTEKHGKKKRGMPCTHLHRYEGLSRVAVLNGFLALTHHSQGETLLTFAVSFWPHSTLQNKIIPF